MTSIASRAKRATESSRDSVSEPEAVLIDRYRMSVLIVGLLAIAAGAGLFLGVYRDNGWVSSQLRGQDFVSLVFGVPALLVSAHLARKGSVRALLAWLGVLGYITYSYLYIFGIAYNELFLVYLTLLVASAYTLIGVLIDLDPVAVWASFRKDAPTKLVARFLVGFGAVLGALWGIQALAALVTGEVPSSVTASGHPTAVVFILDLGLVVPLFLLGGRLLRHGRPWGFVLAGILLFKGITEGLALLGMSLFMFLADHPQFDVALVPLWAFVATASTFLSVRYFGSINQAVRGSPTQTALDEGGRRWHRQRRDLSKSFSQGSDATSID